MGIDNPNGGGNGGDDRLNDLGRRIDAVRDQHPQAKPAAQGRSNVIYRLSTEFVAAVFVGLAFGLGFDYVLGTKPWGIVVFSVLGIAAAFLSVFRAAAQLNAEAQKKENEGK